MGVKYLNNARVAVATTGTGPLAVNGAAPSGWQSWSAAGAVDTDIIPYDLREGANWEVGVLTISSSVTVGTRSVIASSAGGSPITLAGSAVLTAVFEGSDALKWLKRDIENQGPLTGGAEVTSKDLGTLTTGTLTLDMADRLLQHYANNGAHALAPGSVTGAAIIDVTNGAAAGAIDTSAFTQVDGDALTTTNGHKFRLRCIVGNAGSTLNIQAMQ